MTDIYIIGLGVMSVHQITREAELAISASNEVLYLDTGIATQQFLEARCARVTALYESSYREGAHRLNAYYHISAAVIEAALTHPPITFAIHGHPLVAAYAPFLVIDLAKVLGLSINVSSGISAMDNIFSELKIDPCVEGIQMYEATDLMLRQRPLQPDVPALIWQIGNLESRLHTMKISRPERFDRFVQYLMQYYPQEHPLIAIYTPPHPLVPADILHFSLSEMRLQSVFLHTGFTLYIPACEQRSIKDLELLAKVDSPSHLKRITR